MPLETLLWHLGEFKAVSSPVSMDRSSLDRLITLCWLNICLLHLLGGLWKLICTSSLWVSVPLSLNKKLGKIISKAASSDRSIGWFMHSTN